MYNLDNLNYSEFEHLACDILSKKLGIIFYTYPDGRDEGIDLSNKNKSEMIIAQVKHYKKSPFSKLKRALEKDLVKICKHNPSQYYVITSMELTHKNQEEIYEVFSDYMEGTENIITFNEIDNFLQDPSNIDIVQKNYKLWLVASNVLGLIFNQDVLIDSEALADDISRKANLYVRTRSYDIAFELLKRERMIVIVGDPGTGKTTLSNMLLLKLIEDDYKVRTVTNNSLSDLKSSLSQDRSKKEIVYLDDFLGQSYLGINETVPNEIKTLVSFILKSTNKMLILNSRITIINEADRKYRTYREFSASNVNSKFVIDMNKMSLYDRAMILYNHLYFSGASEKYFDALRRDKNYHKIITHNNFNPRIVEFVTRATTYKDVNPDDYFSHCMQRLEFPFEVWNDEFEHRLSFEDRVFSNTLYSLTNRRVDKSVVKIAFDKRLRHHISDTTVNQFEVCLSRLSNSIVIQSEEKGRLLLSMLNPSINDYLETQIKGNGNEVNSIAENAEYVDQLIRLENEVLKDYISQQLLTGRLLELNSINGDISYYYLMLVEKYGIFDEDMKIFVKKAFANIYINAVGYEFNGYRILINKITEKTFFDYYNLEEITMNNQLVCKILEPLSFNDSIVIIEKLYDRDSIQTSHSLNEIMLDKIGYHLQETGDTKLTDYDFEYSDNFNSDSIYEEIMNEVYYEFGDLLENHSNIFGELLTGITEDSFESMLFYFDVDGAIASYYENQKNEFRNDEFRLEKRYDEEYELSEVEKIFR